MVRFSTTNKQIYLLFQCDIIKSMEELEKYVSKVELPIQFGGSRKFSQAEWIQGRLVSFYVFNLSNVFAVEKFFDFYLIYETKQRYKN